MHFPKAKVYLKMSGVKGRSGRKRSSKNREDALKNVAQALPYAIQTILDTATGDNTDKLRYEAACRIEDRALGKSAIAIDAKIQAQRIYSPEELLLMSVDEPKLLSDWRDNALQGQGETDYLPEVTDAEEAGDSEAK